MSGSFNFITGKFEDDKNEFAPGSRFTIVVDEISQKNIGSSGLLPLKVWLTELDGTKTQSWSEIKGEWVTAEHCSGKMLTMTVPTDTGRYFLSLHGGLMFYGSSRMPNDKDHKVLKFYVPNKEAVLEKERADFEAKETMEKYIKDHQLSLDDPLKNWQPDLHMTHRAKEDEMTLSWKQPFADTLRDVAKLICLKKNSSAKMQLKQRTTAHENTVMLASSQQLEVGCEYEIKFTIDDTTTKKILQHDASQKDGNCCCTLSGIEVLGLINSYNNYNKWYSLHVNIRARLKVTIPSSSVGETKIETENIIVKGKWTSFMEKDTVITVEAQHKLHGDQRVEEFLSLTQEMQPFEFYKGLPPAGAKGVSTDTMIGGAEVVLGVAQFILEENPIAKGLSLAVKGVKVAKQIADGGGQIYNFFTAWMPDLMSISTELSALAKNMQIPSESLPGIHQMIKGIVYETIYLEYQEMIGGGGSGATLNAAAAAAAATAADELCLLNEFAPLATVAYKTMKHEMQWRLEPKKYQLICGQLVPKTEIDNEKSKYHKMSKPNFALLANADTKTAVLTVRGTCDLKTGLVDLKVTPARLGDPKTLLTGMCHGEMLRQAKWMSEEGGVLEWMHELHQKNYKIIFTGHSLGGGIATLLALLMKNKYPKSEVTALVYEPAAVVDEIVAAKIEKITSLKIISLLNKNDIIPRLDLSNGRDLILKLIDQKDQAEKFFNEFFLSGLGWMTYHRKKSHLMQVEQNNDESCATEKNDKGNEDSGTVVKKAEVAVEETKGDDETTIEAAKRKATNASEKCDVKATTTLLPIVRMVVPGKIFHVFEQCGQTKYCIIDYKDDSMKKISLTKSCYDDHLCNSWMKSLRDIALAESCKAKPPQWERLSADRPLDQKCGVCRFPLRWRCTDGACDLQAAFNSTNCRGCGQIVCGGCSKKKMSLPHLGIGANSRVCDVCFGN